VRLIAALALREGRLELVPSASDPAFCQAQLLPASQRWDATGQPLDPALLQVGDAVQLGGTLTAQRVLLVTWLCRGHPLPAAAS
jgi:hypothetical protein